MSEELKPCPFCGGEAEMIRHGSSLQSCIVECEDCGCRLRTSETFSSGESWNTRASPWIPCKDRLPETGVKVLAAYLNEYGKRRRVIAVRYDQYQRETNHDNDDIESEYCEEKDEYFWPAGWYEQIDNWCDYSDVFIGHDITHWQPLPAPPGKD